MKLWAGILVVLLLAGCGAASSTAEPAAPVGPAANMANPASTHCVEKGGQVQIRQGTDGGEIGFCVFADGSACEEWAFFRGECTPGEQSGTESDPLNTAKIRDQVLAYISESLGPEALGPLPAEWQVENTTPTGIVGATRIEHRGGDLIVVVSYPIVPPDQVVYTVEVIRTGTSFHWSGEVTAGGVIRPTP